MDTILNRMCEISGMSFSILAGLITTNNQLLSWAEVGSHIVFALITGIVGGLAGLMVKLVWKRLQNQREKGLRAKE